MTRKERNDRWNVKTLYFDRATTDRERIQLMTYAYTRGFLDYIVWEEDARRRAAQRVRRECPELLGGNV